MMEENRDPRSLLTQLNARRAESHREVDEQINAELCRLALGDEAQDFLNGPGELLPFSVPPAVFKGRKPSAIILRGRETSVSTWKQAAVLILRDCDAVPECHGRLLGLRGHVLARYRTLLAETPKGMLSPIRVGRGLYFEGHWDSESMMRLLVERILDEVGYDCQNAAVKCRNVKQGGIVMAEDAQRKAISEGIAVEARQAEGPEFTGPFI